MKKSEAIVKALLARGEREVTRGSAQRFRKFTRRYMGARDGDGNLQEAKPVPLVHGHGREVFWFVSPHGSLRSGPTSAESRRVKDSVRDILIKEGGGK